MSPTPTDPEINAAVERIGEAVPTKFYTAFVRERIRTELLAATQRGAAAAEYRDETFDGLRERAEDAEARLRDAAQRARELRKRWNEAGAFRLSHSQSDLCQDVREFLRELEDGK